MNGSLSLADVTRTLQPLWDIGNAMEMNRASAFRLAALILPHTAADLTVRDVLDLLDQVRRETGGLAP